VRDRGLALGRRIELIISYTEESNWQPFFDFLAQNPPPDLNVALDSEYPVVVAEKGWNSIHLAVPPVPEERARSNRLASFHGGAFLSQIPEDAEAVIADPTPEVEALLREAAERDTAVQFSFTSRGSTLTIQARGLSAHSSKPEDGRNSITHLAALLGTHEWPDGQAARMVRLINDLVGTGDYAEPAHAVAHNAGHGRRGAGGRDQPPQPGGTQRSGARAEDARGGRAVGDTLRDHRRRRPGIHVTPVLP
jgi:dipeptidase D